MRKLDIERHLKKSAMLLVVSFIRKLKNIEINPKEVFISLFPDISQHRNGKVGVYGYILLEDQKIGSSVDMDVSRLFEKYYNENDLIEVEEQIIKLCKEYWRNNTFLESDDESI